MEHIWNEEMKKQYAESVVRTNLLDWYDFERGAALLEINPTCRVLTDCFHGKGLKVAQAGFRDIPSPEQGRYDYVVLLEDISTPDEMELERDFLCRVRELLKKDGVFFLALNNRAGLKYWAGAAEEHTGLPYAGLEGYAEKKKVCACSKPDLEDRLRLAGFGETEFYYPVPDFVFPAAIYTDDFLPQPGDIRGQSASYLGESFSMFQEDQVLEMICRDRMFPYFANSFLIAAKRGGKAR